VAFVKIPLRQHIGEPSVPVVKIGEFVKKNDIIATTGGKMGANIHASISGYVEHISDFISIRRS
jgi:electron transport complex protein RnfC